MDLDALGNLGDFLGGIGVVVTLIYLAIQIRQNTTQLRKNEEAARLDATGTAFAAFSRFRAHIIDRPEVADIYYRGSRDPSVLEPVESMRFFLIAQEIFFILATAFRRASATGVENLRHALGVDGILRQPGLAQWWAREKRNFDPEFIAFIDEDRA